MDKKIGKFIFGIILLGLFVSVISSCGSSVKVCFLGLPQKVQTAIQSQLAENYENQFVFDSLDFADEKTASKLAKKYDLVFGWKGESVNYLEKSAVPVDSAVLNDLPSSYISDFNSNCQYSLPLLLDHYGLFYNTRAKYKAKYKYPETFGDFERNLRKLYNAKIEYPFYVAAGDDFTLITLISALCESYSGTEGYNSFCAGLANYSNFDGLLKTSIGEGKTVGYVLDILKDWQKKGYLQKGWERNSYADLFSFARDEKIGIAFMALSEFRTIGYETSQNFAADRFPVFNTNISHSILAPFVVCVNVSKKPECVEMQKKLLDSAVQKNLSKETSLTPAEKSAQSYDKQADDVRFLAAACKNGPVSSAATVVYESNPEKLAKICADMRLYLKKIE